MPNKAELWRIYFVRNCVHALPQPKDKLIVVVHSDDENLFGFFINSRISPWLQQRPYLLVCEAEILSAEHPCLTHDSYVDCKDLYQFSEQELTEAREQISPQAKESILKALQVCPAVERKYKKAILSREGWPLEPER